MNAALFIELTRAMDGSKVMVSLTDISMIEPRGATTIIWPKRRGSREKLVVRESYELIRLHVPVVNITRPAWMKEKAPPENEQNYGSDGSGGW